MYLYVYNIIVKMLLKTKELVVVTSGSMYFVSYLAVLAMPFLEI